MVNNCFIMFSTVPALLLFAFVTSITPGPNNLMLMASGANFGMRRSLPHMFGISLGHMLMTLILGLGLIGLFQAYPVSFTILKVVSVAYMLWLAWKIAHAAPPADGAAAGKPFTFLQAAAFQWANPKAWAMSLGAITNFAPGQSFAAIALVAAVFAAVNLPSVSLWTLAGREMRRFLTGAGRLRAFNWTMAALLLLSLYPVLTHQAP
jgi:threonine/homoserine/homoserine lactone efflux protein